MRFDTNKMHKNMQSQNTAQTIHVLYANAWESVEKPNETKKWIFLREMRIYFQTQISICSKQVSITEFTEFHRFTVHIQKVWLYIPVNFPTGWLVFSLNLCVCTFKGFGRWHDWTIVCLPALALTQLFQIGPTHQPKLFCQKTNNIFLGVLTHSNLRRSNNCPWNYANPGTKWIPVGRLNRHPHHCIVVPINQWQWCQFYNVSESFRPICRRASTLGGWVCEL